MNILIVEDDFISLEVLKAMLSQYPVQLISASSGVEALEQVHKSHPDLVLLDYELPDMNGIELKTKIDLACAPHCPKVVMISAHQHQEFLDQCKQHDIAQVLAKPVEPRQLDDLLRITGGIE